MTKCTFDDLMSTLNKLAATRAPYGQVFSVSGRFGSGIEKKSGTGRVAELDSLSSGAKMAMKIFVKRVFTISATNASFLRVIACSANLSQ